MRRLIAGLFASAAVAAGAQAQNEPEWYTPENVARVNAARAGDRNAQRDLRAVFELYYGADAQQTYDSLFAQGDSPKVQVALKLPPTLYPTMIDESRWALAYRGQVVALLDALREAGTSYSAEEMTLPAVNYDEEGIELTPDIATFSTPQLLAKSIRAVADLKRGLEAGSASYEVDGPRAKMAEMMKYGAAYKDAVPEAKAYSLYDQMLSVYGIGTGRRKGESVIQVNAAMMQNGVQVLWERKPVEGTFMLTQWKSQVAQPTVR